MNLEINNLSKQYSGDVWGIKDFSISLDDGILGLLGPNGAGKTTLMNMLATITKPTAGQITWNGIDIIKSPNAVREVLGYLPQSFGIYPNLNVIEFLEYIAAIKGIHRKAAKKRIDELLQVVNLTDVRKQSLGSFSGGMKQRVGIAQALLNDPKLLIVDEPTVGLDPEERVRFRNLLADLSQERIVILSTHIVSDVEATATTIALVNQGHLLKHVPPETLLQAVAGKVWEWVLPSAKVPDARQRYLISSMVRRNDGIQLRAVANSSPDNQANAVLPTLEDAYLYHISKNKTIVGNEA